MTLFEPRYVFTPLGLAEAWAIFPNGDDPEWATFIVATGEPWFWKNEFIRLAPTTTNMRRGVSGFGRLNAATLREIERYRQNGFLSLQYDPGDPTTWR
jgi:hypothetical protein